MARKVNHAKIINWNDRQVLVWLVRNDKDLLCVNFQLWVEQSDEQIQAQIEPTGVPEDVVTGYFDELDEQNIETSLKNLGLLDMLQEYENDQ